MKFLLTALLCATVQLFADNCAAQSAPKPEVAAQATGSPVKPEADSHEKATSQKAAGGSVVRSLAVETVKASAMAGTFAGLQCDSDGNLYLKTQVGGVSGIRKLSPKGDELALLQPNLTDHTVRYTGNFSVAPDGDVYQLGEVQDDRKSVGFRYVFVYKTDGTLKSAIKLDPGFYFMASRVAAFASGNTLVTGTEHDPDRENPVQWPFEAIFSSSGTLLRELHFEDDNDIHDMAASADKQVTLPSNPTANLAISGGAAVSGQDGSVYLMRRLSPTPIYVVSPGGNVRRFTVDVGDQGFMPSNMHMADNRIAILFWNDLARRELIKVVDLEGHELGTYQSPVVNGLSAVGPAFVCYSNNPERFTFLTTMGDGKLGIKTAHPQ